MLKLWNQLQKWLEEPSEVNVSNFSAYVAATTLNCCKEYFRSKRPRRWHLRNRLRYLLTHNPELAIWKSKTDDWVAGFSDWKDREHIKIEEPTRFTLNSELLNKVGPGQVKLREVIRLIFRQAEGPLYLDDLVAIVIEIPWYREHFREIQTDDEKEVA